MTAHWKEEAGWLTPRQKAARTRTKRPRHGHPGTAEPNDNKLSEAV